MARDCASAQARTVLRAVIRVRSGAQWPPARAAGRLRPRPPLRLGSSIALRSRKKSRIGVPSKPYASRSWFSR